MDKSINGPVHEIVIHISSVSGEGSGKSVHMRRHARAFNVRIQEQRYFWLGISWEKISHSANTDEKF